MRRALIASAVAAALVAGCGVGPDESREDAADTKNIDKSPPAVVGFNNHYPNVEHKCDGHGHRIFVTTAKTALVITDPSCPGWTPAAAGGFAQAAR